MIVDMVKLAGGALVPADDIEAEKLTAIKTGEQYPFEYKRARNPKFHKKVFAFFNYCFEHYSGKYDHIMDTKAQRETMRKELIVLAGYRDVTYKMDGGFRVEAKSISFAAMDDDEFRSCYSALINIAMRTIFNGCDDSLIQEKLYSFF